MMKRVAVFYATREGQARKVAQHLSGALVSRGLEVALHEVRDAEGEAALALSDAAIVVASVHVGEHEPEAVAFVRAHPRLAEIPASFVSVSMAEAHRELATIPAAERAIAARQVTEQVERFLAKTHWRPAHVQPVAGALLYTHYNVLVRWVMKQISKSEHLPTDTTRDWEMTDWATIDAFAKRLAEELVGG